MIINLRRFREMNVEEIRGSLPITVTSDGTPVFEIKQIDTQSITSTSIDNQSTKQAKLAELRALIAKPKRGGLGVLITPKLEEEIPIYNPAIHRPGDRVRVWYNGKYMTKTIPNLDAEGNPY